MKTANDIRQQVDSIIDSWRAGATPNAREVLERLAGIECDRSVALDLAYEEYCLRQEAGQSIDAAEFCRQFPSLQHSLTRMLDVHRCLKSQSFDIPLPASPVWPAIGSEWLDWKLIKVLGRGTFSRVYLAEEPSLGNRQVVVKCSQSGLKEAFILGRLAHSNVVPIHSIRAEPETGLTAICMPFLGDSTLADELDSLHIGSSFSPLQSVRIAPSQLKRRQSSRLVSTSSDRFVEKVVSLVVHIVEALVAAHEKGISHGDVKPSNILISFAGQPMLLDFNLSIAEDGSGRFGGTPPYMAPELFNRLAMKNAIPNVQSPVELRSDQFSLGVILFELLTGRPAFEVDFSGTSPTYRDVREEILGTKPVFATDRALLQIVDRCLAIDPLQRFASMRAVASQIMEYQKACRTRKNRRRVLLGSTAAIVSVSLVAAIGMSVRSSLQPTESQRLLQSAIGNIEQGDHFTAAQQLGHLNREHPSQVIAAWAAYCHAKNESYSASDSFNGFALKEEDKTGRIWNNKGMSSAQLGHLAEAEKELSRAIEINPQLQAAYINRAKLRLRVALQSRTLPTEAIADIEQAIAIGPESAALHYLAASAYAHAKSLGFSIDPELIESHVLKAMSFGEPTASFLRSHLFGDLDVSALATRVKFVDSSKREFELLLAPAQTLQSEMVRLGRVSDP